MPEADWKKFKKVRLKALERLSQRILDESRNICAEKSLTAHERYGKLYDLIQERDKEMARAFDDFSRSTAVICLKVMVFYDLLTDQELAEFSPMVQNIVNI